MVAPLIIAGIIIFGALSALTGAVVVKDQSEAAAKATLIKAEGEKTALERGSTGATSEDWFWGAFTKQEAYERGKEDSNILADSKYKRAGAISGEDTSTGAPGTANKPKTGNDSATAATDSKGFPEISGLITPIIYIGLIILIFMLIKGR